MALWIALLGAIFLLWLNGAERAQVGVYRDDAAYVVLADSLVHAGRYGLFNVPGEPAVTQFPFGFPLLLSFLRRLYPDNLDALKVLSLIATLANVSLLFWGWRSFSRRTSRWWGLAVGALYAVSPLTLAHSTLVMSEPVFTTWCLLAIIFAERLARTASSRPSRRWWTAALSISLTFVLFTRTIGIVLLACVALYLLVRRGRAAPRTLAVIAVQMALVLGIVVAVTPVRWIDLLPQQYLRDQNAIVLMRLASIFTLSPDAAEPAAPVPVEPDAPPAIGGIAQDASNEEPHLPLGEMLRYNLQRHLLEDVRGIALGIGGGDREYNLFKRTGIPLTPVLNVLVLALVVAGFVRGFRTEGLTLFLLFPVLYFGSVLLWTWEGVRMLYPIQPQIQFGLLLGVEAALVGIVALVRRARLLTPDRAGRAAPLALASLAGALVAVGLVKGLHLPETRVHVGDLQARGAWLKAHSAPSDIVMTENPVVDYLYLDRKTLPFPSALHSPALLQEYLAKHGIRYVTIAPKLTWKDRYVAVYSDETLQLLDLLGTLAEQQQVEQVHAGGSTDVQVFRVKPW